MFLSDNKTKLLLLTFLIAAMSSVSHAELFSSTNRYSLERVTGDSLFNKGRFISLPNLYINDTVPYFLGINLKNEYLAMGARGIASLETADNDATGFGVLQGNAQFLSPYLESRVKLNWYTLKRADHAEPSDIEFERFYSGKAAVISGMFDNDFTLPEAYLKLKYKDISLTIGKEKLRWGPGYKGTLAISGTSLAPFYYYHLRINLASRIHLSCFLAGYDDDRLYLKDFTGIDTIKSVTKKTKIVSLPSRYGVGQRMDIRINDHLQFGLHELCNFYGTNDLTRYANPLQVYYLGYNSGTNEANMMAGCDVNVLYKPFRIYGEFLDDDITIFDNKGNPNKYAFQLGAMYYHNKKVKEIGIEYTHVSKYTYGHYSILNRYEYWGESTGWPWGNDQDLFNAHFLMQQTEKLMLKFEVDYWIKGAGTLKDDWYIDGCPDLDHAPYWPQNSKKIVSFIVGCEYKPFKWLSLIIDYKPSFEGSIMYNDMYSYLTLDIPAKKSIIW